MCTSTLAMFIDRVESCKISVCQEQSAKVNAFLICRDPHGVAGVLPPALQRTLRVGCKDNHFLLISKGNFAKIAEKQGNVWRLQEICLSLQRQNECFDYSGKFPAREQDHIGTTSIK